MHLNIFIVAVAVDSMSLSVSKRYCYLFAKLILIVQYLEVET